MLKIYVTHDFTPDEFITRTRGASVVAGYETLTDELKKQVADNWTRLWYVPSPALEGAAIVNFAGFFQHLRFEQATNSEVHAQPDPVRAQQENAKQEYKRLHNEWIALCTQRNHELDRLKMEYDKRVGERRQVLVQWDTYVQAAKDQLDEFKENNPPPVRPVKAFTTK